jgi:hypothetical protein
MILMGKPEGSVGILRRRCVKNIYIFFIFLNLFAICRDTFSKWCVGKRGRVEECSVAPLRNKRLKTWCGCRENMDLGETGRRDMDWIDLVQVRDRWTALLNAVMNLRVP